MSKEATGRIKIIKTPSGEAPFRVRQALVGCILPCYPRIGIPLGDLRGILSADPIKNNKRGVVVAQSDLIAAVLQYNRDAGNWWIDNGFGKEDGFFFFFEDEFEIISGVSEAPMQAYDNMETGHWRRMN